MKRLFTRVLFKYVALYGLIFVSVGLILSHVVTDQILLIAVLAIAYLVLLVILLHFHDRFIKPIKYTSKAVDQLVEGNYHARVQTPAAGKLGSLNTKINLLARNLSELSIQETIQAEHLSTVIDNTESGLLLIDEKGYIHLANRKFISMFGKTVEDYVGYIYYDVLDHEKMHTIVQQTFLYEKNIKGSFKQRNQANNLYLEVVGAPIFNKKGELRGAVLVIYDITELKKLEVMRKDFVANVSHELKTPITSILGFAETLLDGSMHNKEELETFLTIIYDESRRLQVLTEDLLTLAKLEEDSFELDTTIIHVHDLLEEVLSVVSHQAEKKEISLHVDVEEDITFEADFLTIKQMLINLLENAISYTANNGSVSLVIDGDDTAVNIKVSDTGIGLQEKEIDRIFERFYRVDQDRSRNTGGTGLGLAIVKHVVETHKGTIQVQSKINEGTTFIVTLQRTISK